MNSTPASPRLISLNPQDTHRELGFQPSTQMWTLRLPKLTPSAPGDAATSRASHLWDCRSHALKASAGLLARDEEFRTAGQAASFMGEE